MPSSSQETPAWNCALPLWGTEQPAEPWPDTRSTREGSAPQPGPAAAPPTPGTEHAKTAFPFKKNRRHEMDQRPNDRIPPRPDDPMQDDMVGRPSRTNW